jgi:SAM-dependent methyltransferase
MLSQVAKEVQQHWDTVDLERMRRVAWLDIRAFSDDIWRTFSGGKGPADAVLQILAERLRRAGRSDAAGVALLCGDMTGERRFFEQPDLVRFRSVCGYDISPASLARYTPPPGLAFTPVVADCNELRLEPNSVDLIVGWHGIHHAENIGNIFYQMHHALTDEGLVILYEWIGPPYLQVPARNHFLAASLLWCLFPSEEVRTTHEGLRKGFGHILPGPESFEPSEACNSNLLRPMFLRYFEPLSEYLHGGLSFPMFEGIAQNLDQRRPENQRKFAVVQRLEKVLTRLGVVRPLFMVTIGQKRRQERPTNGNVFMRRAAGLADRLRQRFPRRGKR